MVDVRFHAASEPTPLGVLLGALVGDLGLDERSAARVMAGAEELTVAGPRDIALAAHSRYADDLRATAAGAVIVSAPLREAVPPGTIAIVAAQPHELFVTVLDRLYPPDLRAAHLGTTATAAAPLLEEGVRIGPGVVLGAGVEVGRNTIIGANTVIGHGVTIGRNCVIASNCTIDCAHVGNHVVIHAGARIGGEGFGWLGHGTTNRKVPQLGRVIVQDRVELGANTTVDRGALGDTVIGEGTKVDNLVQVGHNCRIGRNCLIAGRSGLSGSTVLGDGVLMGGGAGTAGHQTIGAGSTIRAGAAVVGSFPPGSDVAGVPAQDFLAYQREFMAIRRLTRREQQ